MSDGTLGWWAKRWAIVMAYGHYYVMKLWWHTASADGHYDCPMLCRYAPIVVKQLFALPICWWERTKFGGHAWIEECMVCGGIDCPDGEPLHYHHDACPACWCREQEANRNNEHFIHVILDNPGEGRVE